MALEKYFLNKSFDSVWDLCHSKDRIWGVSFVWLRLSCHGNGLLWNTERSALETLHVATPYWVPVIIAWAELEFSWFQTVFPYFIITGICISSPRLPFSYPMLLLEHTKRESLRKWLCIRCYRETKFSWLLQHFRHLECFLLNSFSYARLLLLRAKEHHIEQLPRMGTIYFAFFNFCSQFLRITHIFYENAWEIGCVFRVRSEMWVRINRKIETTIYILLCQHLFELNG